jgi:hypothetical protein
VSNHKSLYTTIYVLVLMLFLCACGTPSYAVDGMWKGTTDTGKEVSLEIKDQSIKSFNVGFEIPNCPLLSASSIGEGDTFSGNSFSITSENETFGTRSTFTGTFTSDTAASGSFEMTVTPSANFPSCNGTTTAKWTATKQ